MGMDAMAGAGGSGAGFMQYAGMGMSLLGGITKATGQQAAGEAGGARYQYQAAVYRNNKLIADQAAKDSIQSGKEKAQVSQLKTAQIIGQQRAELAAKGIQVDTDTSVEAMVDAARIGNMDQETIQRNAERQALALKLQGIGYEMQAQMAERAAKDTKKAGDNSFFSTLLGTAGNVATKWMSMGGGSGGGMDFSGTSNSTIAWNDNTSWDYGSAGSGWGGDL
jgi:hypothetical protein